MLKQIKRHLKDFGSGLLAVLVAFPFVCLSSFIIGILVRAIVAFFGFGFNLL